jgi:hypothetical protein
MFCIHSHIHQSVCLHVPYEILPICPTSSISHFSGLLESNTMSLGHISCPKEIHYWLHYVSNGQAYLLSYNNYYHMLFECHLDL